MMALVGASGAGKSTLASLLCRLYDPTSGSILIDGLDLRKCDVTTWQNHIRLVTQDIFLFNDTVLNNIRFGFEDIDIQKIYEAARMAAAIDFIEELPQGWDTQLGEMGVRLSGGQKQRISIARAILNNPEILIMDEATSHLDSVTEQTIQQTVNTFAKGRIIEQGGHDELAAKHGAYWNLLQHQIFKQDATPEQIEKANQ
jgi:subfamily B ATP-binding cassette protein MsbA